MGIHEYVEPTSEAASSEVASKRVLPGLFEYSAAQGPVGCSRAMLRPNGHALRNNLSLLSQLANDLTGRLDLSDQPDALAR